MRQLIFLLLVGILLIGTAALAEEMSEEATLHTSPFILNTPPLPAGDITTPCGGGGSDGGGGAPG